MSNTKELEELLREAKRYLPVLESVEKEADCWDSLTQGTGIATVNGLRNAIAKAEAAATPQPLYPQGSGMKGKTVYVSVGDNGEIPQGAVWVAQFNSYIIPAPPDQSPQPSKEPESQREAFEGLMIDYARECWKMAANAFRMYTDNKHTFSDAREYLLNYGRKQFQLDEKFTPTSAKTDKEIEELAEVYVPVEIKEGCELPRQGERVIWVMDKGNAYTGHMDEAEGNWWVYIETEDGEDHNSFSEYDFEYWLKPIRIPAAMTEIYKAAKK